MKNSKTKFKAIRITVDKWLEDIPMETAMNLYPLSPQFRFLLKDWMQAPLYGPAEPNLLGTVTRKVKPTLGVPQGPALGYIKP